MIYSKATPFDLLSDAQSGPMSDHLVRISRLKQLQSERAWNDSELARQCGRKPQQVRAWYSASPDKKQGRLIGEKLARSLEEALDLPRYYLDERAGTPARFDLREGSQSHRTSSIYHSATAHEGTQVPVLGWEQMSMFEVSNASLPTATPTLPTFAEASSKAKFVSMPDDSMAPIFQPGDHILFDPAQVPRAGDTVLVRLATLEYFVRTFKPRTANIWEAVPINNAYDKLSSELDQAELVAVMVEHRRYRRP